MRRALGDAATVGLASATAQAAVMLQGGSPISAGWLIGYAALAVVFLRVLGSSGRCTLLQDVRVVLSATALAALVILTLRMQPGLTLGGVVETMRQWTFVAGYLLAARVGGAWCLGLARPAQEEDEVAIVETPAFAEVAARELARARRHERPLALLDLSVAAERATSRGSQRRDLRSLSAALASSLRLTDAFGAIDGRLVAILAETGSESVDRLLERLSQQLEPEVAGRLRVGHATFPDEEVTLVGLRERAAERARPVEQAAPESTRVAEAAA